MQKKKILEKLRENRVKLTIISAVTVVAVVGGVSTYFVKAKDSQRIVLNKEVLAEELDQELNTEEFEGKTNKTSTKKVVNDTKDKKVKEEKTKVDNEGKDEATQEQEKTSTDANVTTNNTTEYEMVEEEPKKVNKPKDENKHNHNSNNNNNTNTNKVNTKPITYVSKGLGIAFDMPASWKDKYAIKDDGASVAVYTKHGENFSNGVGLLFVITNDLSAYTGGASLDSLGGIIPKQTTIGDKQFLVLGTIDSKMGENDPLVETFKTMGKEKSQVLSTLRLA